MNNEQRAESFVAGREIALGRGEKEYAWRCTNSTADNEGADFM